MGAPAQVALALVWWIWRQLLCHCKSSFGVLLNVAILCCCKDGIASELAHHFADAFVNTIPSLSCEWLLQAHTLRRHREAIRARMTPVTTTPDMGIQVCSSMC